MSNAPFKDSAPMGGYVEPHRATMLLILGILGLFCVQLLGPITWLLASGDLKKMQAGTMDRAGESNTQIAYVLGIVGTVFMAIGCVIGLLYFVVVVIAIGAGAAAQ